MNVVVCINNDQCKSSLTIGKRYEVLKAYKMSNHDYYKLKGVDSSWYQRRFKVLKFKLYLELL